MLYVQPETMSRLPLNSNCKNKVTIQQCQHLLSIEINRDLTHMRVDILRCDSRQCSCLSLVNSWPDMQFSFGDLWLDLDLPLRQLLNYISFLMKP